jgi:hypothetical protein
MADTTTARAGRRGRYYTPPAHIRPGPGVTKTETGSCDLYSGTAEALIDSGVITMDMLPGQPSDAGAEVMAQRQRAAAYFLEHGVLPSWAPGNAGPTARANHLRVVWSRP